jgi:hypothetical protein
MTKIEKLQKHLKVLVERTKEIDAILKPIDDWAKPYRAEIAALRKESAEIRDKIKEMSFEPSLEFFLSHDTSYFTYHSETHSGTLCDMQKYMNKNFKYIRMDGYNVNTNIYAVEITLKHDADFKEMYKEINYAMKLAIKAKQDYFRLRTDNYNESPRLWVKDGKFKLADDRWSSADWKSFDTLKEALQYAIKIGWTHGKPGVE